MTGTTWRALTRPELKVYDKEMQDLILAAIERGGVGRISSKGHCILRAPAGGTMSISRNTNTGGRTAQNNRADFKRLFGDLTPVTDTDTDIEQTGTDVETSLEVTGDNTRPTLHCPVDDCEAEFVTEGARYTHVQTVHHRCMEPGCDYIGQTGSALAAHRRTAHGNHKPWEKGIQVKQQRVQAATTTLQQIRDLLGMEAPSGATVKQARDELKQAKAELKVAHKKIAELEAKLAKLRSALE